MALSNRSRWLLLAPISLAAVICGSAASFAQANTDENAILRAADQAVRTGDFSRAATLLRRSAESGNSEAQYRLASLYRSGRGVPQDELLAFKWMKAAAEQNHPNAQFNLATMYLAGRGVASDAGLATVWLKKAASHGHDEAAKRLAEISTRRAVEPAAPNAAPPPTLEGRREPAEGRREPAKIATSAQRSLANTPRTEGTEILTAAWRGQTDAV